eukprot:755592-Hanusia_phi.AAC.5
MFTASARETVATHGIDPIFLRDLYQILRYHLLGVELFSPGRSRGHPGPGRPPGSVNPRPTLSAAESPSVRSQ